MKNEKNKGTDKQYVALFCHTIQLISNMGPFFDTQYNSSRSSFVPNFRILSQVVTKKSLTEENVHMYYIRVTEGKYEKLKKESKIKISITNRGTDKQYIAVFVTQYNSSLSSFVPNFRFISQIVAEKSLTEKKFTDNQTNKQTKLQKRQKLYTPIYFVPGYNN